MLRILKSIYYIYLFIMMHQSTSTTSTTHSQTQGHFTEEATTFRMKVTYVGDKSISIHLEDFEDYIIYQKHYSADNNSNEIHRRMGIQDIVYSLTKAYDIKGKAPRIGDQANIRQYQIGDLIEVQGIPYYRVNKNGRIIVYHSVINKKTKEELNFESVLQLDKVGTIAEGQVAREKELMENKKLKKELLNIRLQKQRIESMYDGFTLQGFNSVWLPHVFHIPIARNSSYVFKVRVNNFGTSPSQQANQPRFQYIGMGVVDITNYKVFKTMMNQNYAVGYYCMTNNIGQKYPGGAQEGSGYVEGAVVEVHVSLANKSIRWAIGGTTRAMHTHDMLGDENRIFMPYIEVCFPGSSLQWVS